MNWPNRLTSRWLSSAAGVVALPAAMAGLVMAVPACAQPAPGDYPAGLASLRTDADLAAGIDRWRYVERSDNLSFADYAGYLLRFPGWPGEATIRANAEKRLMPSGESPSLVAAFFRSYPPQTNTAKLRFAEALLATGKAEEARAEARQAWIGGALAPEDEAAFAARFAGALRPGDQDLRMEALLWARAAASAARQIALVSPQRRTEFEARLAYISRAPDAAQKAGAVEPVALTKAGYIADKSYWLRNTGQLYPARTLLANHRTLEAPPADPVTWLKILDTTSKSAETDGQWSLVWGIARQLDDAYPPGTIIRDRSFSERDSYTNLAWRAGQTALEKLGRPGDAVGMFERYANAARSPQTRARGLYWAGRAADAAHQKERATAYFEQAAQFYDQFHGQMAADRLGRSIELPTLRPALAISAAERDAFENASIVRAAKYLGRMGQRQDQTRFVRTIAARVKTEQDHALASQLAVAMNRPDLGLLVGKSARERGYEGYLAASFPQLQVPAEHRLNWTMIHAITRQESQFDREAVSPVGARGLMQLMPGTARETSAAAGVSYDFGALTSDTQYNMRLGATYFSQLMDRYGGSFVLSVAAYNAGPGNVSKWVRANGDPRTPGVDVVRWIESIPIAETRGYVQRVLENAVVYDKLNPQRSAQRNVRLASYLGQAAAYGGP